MYIFIEGTAYPKHKSGGAIEEADLWSQNIREVTVGLQPIHSPCRMRVEFLLPIERFTSGSPYGSDLDNLTKRLLDDLKKTILREVDGEDGSIMEMAISKRAAINEKPGVKVEIEPLRCGVTDDEFLYFAYGSNMYPPRIEKRVKRVKKVCNVYLPGYRLRTNKVGDDGTGKANIEPDAGCRDGVWGVLWLVPESSREALDGAEGYKPGKHDSHYKPKEFIVFESPSAPWKAMAYVACQGRTKSDDLPVRRDYYDYILQGAVLNGLPQEYIEKLGRIKVA